MPIKWQHSVRNGLDVLELVTAASSCDVALHGAQVLRFTPRGDRDWLWVSERARWNVGSALRGGVPICFPWFGPHPTEPGFPAHGFARTRIWRLVGVEEVAGGRLQAELELHADERTLPLFPHRFRVRTRVIVGEDLELAFEVANEGDAPFRFETALHSYFSVSDVAAISVEGLAGSPYIDKVASGARRQPDDKPLRFVGEVDRVYDSGGPLTLVDPGRARPLGVGARGAASTVVWNPGPEKARALGDLEPASFQRFVCIETGNIGDHQITLLPGGRHSLSVRYFVSASEVGVSVRR